jgi:hypothetical protein
MLTQFIRMQSQFIKKSTRTIHILRGSKDVAFNSKNKVGFQCIQTEFDGQEQGSEEYHKKSMHQLSKIIHNDLCGATVNILYIKRINQTSLINYERKEVADPGHLITCLANIDKGGNLNIIDKTYVSKTGPKKAIYQSQKERPFISSTPNPLKEFGSSQYYTITNLSETSVSLEKYIKNLSSLKKNDEIFELYERNCSHAALAVIGLADARAISPQTASRLIDQDEGIILDSVLRENIKILYEKTGLIRSGQEVYKASPYYKKGYDPKNR